MSRHSGGISAAAVAGCFPFTVFGGDAYAQVGGPPCCTTPAILKSVEGLPPGETPEQLAAWAREQAAHKTSDQLKWDVEALRAACSGGCSGTLLNARNILASVLAERLGSETFPPCCATEPKGQAGTLRGVSERPAASTSGGPVNRYIGQSILQRLRGWNGTLEAAQQWLRPELERLSPEDLSYLGLILTASCHQPGRCTDPLVLGREMVAMQAGDMRRAQEREELEHQRQQDRLDVKQQRLEEVRLRRSDQLINLLAAALGGLIGVGGALLPGYFDRRSLRRREAESSEEGA